MVATVLDLADRGADEDGFLAMALRAGIHHGGTAAATTSATPSTWPPASPRSPARGKPW
ncbi:hypothetical protein [Mycobacterium nebraskense]|uniref:hypothetical protein n=1 Tax=Mycobacterium nebraskense TaxID=244292 RepID=UPI000A63CFD0|nr:hypothetical protein [Mycobacterium nebraskense]